MFFYFYMYLIILSSLLDIYLKHPLKIYIKRDIIYDVSIVIATLIVLWKQYRRIDLILCSVIVTTERYRYRQCGLSLKTVIKSSVHKRKCLHTVHRKITVVVFISRAHSGVSKIKKKHKCPDDLWDKYSQWRFRKGRVLEHIPLAV